MPLSAPFPVSAVISADRLNNVSTETTAAAHLNIIQKHNHNVTSAIGLWCVAVQATVKIGCHSTVWWHEDDLNVRGMQNVRVEQVATVKWAIFCGWEMGRFGSWECLGISHSITSVFQKMHYWVQVQWRKQNIKTKKGSPWTHKWRLTVNCLSISQSLKTT